MSNSQNELSCFGKLIKDTFTPTDNFDIDNNT